MNANLIRFEELHALDYLSTDERETIVSLLDEIATAVGSFPYEDAYNGEWLEF
jgi:hypothetical protein